MTSRRLSPPATPMETAGPTWQGRYELEPLFDLPELDLSVSIRSHYVRNSSLHSFIRKLGASVFTFVGYMVYLVVGIVVFVIPAPTGRLLAVVGVLTGIWASLLSIGNLRLDMVRVLIKTYDVWFFTTVSTIVSVLLGLLLRDERSMLLAMSWISYLTNVFIDASVTGLRRLWIANVFSMGCYLLMAFSVSWNITDELVIFDIFRLNGHALPAVGVFRDGIISMVVVIVRNLYRTQRYLTKSSQVASETGVTVECVTFRCRLRVRTTDRHPPQLEVQGIKAASSRGAIEATVNTTQSKVLLRFRPFLEPMDPRYTCIGSHTFLKFASTYPRSFACIGITGFVITRAVMLTVLLVPSLGLLWQIKLLAAVGALCSVVYVSICLSASHRRLALAVMSCFDFGFIVAQCAVAITSLLDLLSWQPALVIAFVGEGFWCAGLLMWDALLPPTRAMLRLSSRQAAYTATGVGLTIMISIFVTFVWLEPHQINDRALFHIKVGGQRIEFRPISWFMSCLATILAWGIRMGWRLWQATETELVILDGPVEYQLVKGHPVARK